MPKKAAEKSNRINGHAAPADLSPKALTNYFLGPIAVHRDYKDHYSEELLI